MSKEEAPMWRRGIVPVLLVVSSFVVPASTVGAPQNQLSGSDASACVRKSSTPSGYVDAPYLAAVRNDCTQPVHVYYCAKLPSQKCFSCMPTSIEPGRVTPKPAEPGARIACSGSAVMHKSFGMQLSSVRQVMPTRRLEKSIPRNPMSMNPALQVPSNGLALRSRDVYKRNEIKL